MLLSIISPFYNSEKKCSRLLETLRKIDDPDIELILIDDGSTDCTYQHLQEFKKNSKCKTIIKQQENKGPGGARNHGLSISSGKYLWFIDSDDDISLAALDTLKHHSKEDYDLIDFDYESKTKKTNSMSITPGEYTDPEKAKEILLDNFGRIWTKIIKKEIITKNRIFYPENCIYEDNPLSLIYPFHINRFYKSSTLGYFHHEDFESVTRSKPSPRFFDRLSTAAYGAEVSLSLATHKDHISKIESRFTQIFLANTIPTLLKRADLIGAIQSARVMKHYRESAEKLKIETNPFKKLTLQKNKKLNNIYKIIFKSIWVASYLLPSQESYFKNQHLACWKSDINYPQ